MVEPVRYEIEQMDDQVAFDLLKAINKSEKELELKASKSDTVTSFILHHIFTVYIRRST